MKQSHNEQTVYLVRHGEKKFFTPEPGLTDLGREQAKRAGQYLQGLLKDQPTLLLCSPKQRTQETALIIQLALGGKFRIDNDFNISVRFDSKRAFLDKLDRLGAENIVVVTHSQNIRQIVGDFFKVNGDIRECSVTTIKRVGDELKLVETFRET